MGSLVEDLLVLARLDQGRPLELGPVDLAQIAHARVLHLTGITAAVSDDCYALIVALLDCARRTAAAAGLPRTVLWRTPQSAPPGSAALEDRLGRLDSVPMFRPLHPRLGSGAWAWIPRALWV